MDSLKPILSDTDARLYRVEGRPTPVERYVFTCAPTRELCTDANLCGQRGYTSRLDAGLELLFSLFPDPFEGVEKGRVNILNILTGGDAWRMPQALMNAVGIDEPRISFLWTKRGEDANGNGCVEHYHENIKARSGDIVALADIAAGGTSLDYALSRIHEKYREAGAAVDSLVFVTIGGEQAERRVEAYIPRFQALNPDFKARVFYLEGRFAIAEKGAMHPETLEKDTDFILPGSLVAPELYVRDASDMTHTLEKCRAYYGSRRHANPRAHLLEVKEHWQRLAQEAANGWTLFDALNERALFPPGLSQEAFAAKAGALWALPSWEFEGLHDAYRHQLSSTEHLRSPRPLVRLCEARLSELERILGN